jgi:hypothetical protein
MDELKRIMSINNIELNIDDKRNTGDLLDVEFLGSLTEEQMEDSAALNRYDCGILSAATAFGKTAMRSYNI